MTGFTVIKKENIQKIRGKDEMKIKYTIQNDETGEILIILSWSCLKGQYVIYDNHYDNDIMKHTWTTSTSGYVYSHDIGYMHSFIAKLMGLDITNKSYSIDHIDMIKLDNRSKNLRLATQSEQNSNRNTRSDKIPPCMELQAIGIYELPRYVRWDNSESKFIIEKHPILIDEVKNSKRKKPNMSGSKSKHLSVVQKYQDILARLNELNDKLLPNEVQLIKEQNKKEYQDICKCISLYENDGMNIINEPIVHDTILEPQRRTCQNRKTECKLPPDCGVRQEDIPKYCYYRPASEKRGDKFVIDKHPALLLISEGKRQWSTTEKTSITTREKYDLLMEKYNELENIQF